MTEDSKETLYRQEMQESETPEIKKEQLPVQVETQQAEIETQQAKIETQTKEQPRPKREFDSNRRSTIEQSIQSARNKSKYNVDIDKIRMNPSEVKLIKGLEKTTNNCRLDCVNCVYREKDLGHCWYTMVTNESNHIIDNSCTHFVSKESYININRCNTR